jgi:outer membrane protein OmpA-like peptidoglycan-associated protein/tetratricopeptide (TPR) repeat protein
MNKRILFIIILLIAGITTVSYCQIKKAKKEMTLYNYSEALVTLEKLFLKKNTDKQEITLLIAECYRKLNDVQQAKVWFEKSLEYDNTDSSQLFNYAQILRSYGYYDKAKEYFLRYDSLFPGDPRAVILADFCKKAYALEDLPPVFEVKNAAALNSREAEFGPVFNGKTLWFTSDRHDSTEKTKSYGWTGNDYLHLYISEPVSVDDLYQGFKKIYPAPDMFNKEYHDGPASFSADFKEIFFNRTLTRKDKGKKEENKIRTHLLKIYHSTRYDSTWSKPMPFILNSNDHSVGHPALSGNGNLLYFVSDMAGGYGGTDLYVCTRDSMKWSSPVNLGPGINTFGNEMFPFISHDDDLYFASDGHPGFGGLDVFISHLEDDNWSPPENLGKPVNTSYDDFSLYISNDGTQGVFSSNRPGGIGSDDLYLLRRLPEPAPVIIPYLSGYVKNKRSLGPVYNSTVFIYSRGRGQVDIVKTDSNGYYRTEIQPGESYIVKAMSTGFIADLYLFKPDSQNIIAQLTAPRDLLIEHLANDQNFVLENIYYDLNKWNIREDAKPSLNRLVTILKENPLNIELGSHTDCRASDQYNLQLSQRRAESAVDYIISQGINRDRITAKGYGETQLINKCKDRVPCTEDEHQQNRRTEFKVISIFKDKKRETFDLSNYIQGDVIDVKSLPDDFFGPLK